MPPHRPRTALAAGLLLVPMLTGLVGIASAAPDASFVLSVSPGFSPAELPAGAEVVTRLRGVGAVQVTAPASSLANLASTPGVRGVRLDFALRALGASSSTTGGVLAPETVGAPAGKNKAGKGVTVAVIDTGVEDTSGLQRADGHLLRGPDFSGETAATRDGFGHGTFMANLVAGGAVASDVVGVAPGATVIDVKVAGADGSTTLSKVLQGLNWVAEKGVAQGIRVVSLSMGAARPTSGYGSDPLTDAADAVQKAGIVVVTASGNDPTQVSDPGQDPQLFTIGAADTTGATAAVASFSGRGYPAGMRKPDVVATGLHVLSVLPAGSAIAQANPGAQRGNLWRGNGTSQATAVAAGAVAIFLSGRTDVSPQDVRASFGTAARDLEGDADGYGLLVLPTTLVDGDANLTPAPPAGDGGGTPSPSGTSWSGTSWSGTSWSGTSWSGTSWSGTSWSGTSWSGTSWSASSWS